MYARLLAWGNKSKSFGDRRGNGVDRERRQHDAGARRLVEEDELLNGRTALAAVLRRPADTEPAVGPEPVHGCHVERPAALALGELGLVRRGHELGEVRAQLAAERLLLGGVVEVHRGSLSASGGRLSTPRDAAG